MLSAHSVRRLVAAAGIAGLGTALTATAAHAAPVTAAPHTAPAMAQPDAADTTGDTTTTATSADSGAAAATSGGTTATTHTVVAGDTLWRIARTEQTAGGWQALYDLNRDQLTGGPDRLDIGQVLKLAGVAPTATGATATTTSSSPTTTDEVVAAKPASTKPASGASTGSASAGTGTSAAATTAPASSKAAAAIAFAKAQLGKPYVYGAEGPDAYDCSGLVQAAWKAAGVSIPRVTTDQFAAGPKVSTSDLKPGDLVFYYSGISHVGMYLGDGQIIHAPNSRSVVKIVPVDSMPIAGATRPA